ncbi:MAG: DUF4091 domain-containing protein [Lentisphaeria bacterium]|nr:DUF4091 domain-containing protein [Lentisphaeria bacterium]
MHVFSRPFFVVGLLSFCCFATDPPAPTLGDVMLFDFEDETPPEQLSRRDLTDFALTGEWCTDGRRAAVITFHKWTEGREKWPAVVADRSNGALSVTDFSLFSELRWDLHNPGRKPILVKLHLRDGVGKRFTHVVTVPPRSTLPCAVSIAKFSLDTRDIAQLHFFTTQPVETYSFYVDRVRLHVGLRELATDLQHRAEALENGLAEPLLRAGGALPPTLLARLRELRWTRLEIDGLALALAEIEPESWKTVSGWRTRIEELGARVDGLDSLSADLRALAYAKENGLEGFVTFVESSMRKIPLDGGGLGSRFGASIELEAARNEREHAQIVVVPFEEDLRDVSWSARSLVGPGGRLVPVRVRLVGYVDCKKPSYKVSRTGWWADPLIEAQKRVDRVPLGEVLALWVTVDVPAGAPAGAYCGTVKLAAAGVAAQEVEIRLTVWDFVLPDHTSLRTALSFRSLSRKLYPKGDLDVLTSRYENWLQDECHLNVGSIYSGPPSWSATRLKELMGMGLNAINLGYFNAPRGDKFREEAHWKRFDALVARIKSYMPVIEEAGARDLCYIYCFDERPPAQLDVVFETARRLKAIWPDIEVMTTAYDSTFGLDREDGDAIDIWVPLTPKFDTNAARLAEAREQGRDVWWYICIGPKNPYANWFVEYTAIEPRLIMGAMTAKYRPGGFLYYAVNRWPLNDRTIGRGPRTDWNPASYKNNNGDGSFFCAGPEGPLSTIRLENIRDGLEDYEYYVLLRRLVDSQPERGWAKRLLWRERPVSTTEAEVPESVVKDLRSFTYDPEIVRAERRRVAGLIAKLLQRQAVRMRKSESKN